MKMEFLGDSYETDKKKKRFRRHTPYQIQRLESHNTRELITVNSRKRTIRFVRKTLRLAKLSKTPFAITVVILLSRNTLTLMNRSFESKNAQLREELERVSNIAAKFMGRPLSHLPPQLNPMHISPLESFHSAPSLDYDLLPGSCSSVTLPTLPSQPNLVLSDMDNPNIFLLLKLLCALKW